MEVFASIFKQRGGLKRSNESKAGTSRGNRKIDGPRSMPTGHQPAAHKLNRTTSYFAQLRPNVENEFREFGDRYEIILNCSSVDLQKADLSIKYNEIDNQIKIIGIQSKKFGQQIVLNRKMLRCFRLPNDIRSDRITSVFQQCGQLKIRIPKATLVDGSDGESSLDECTECEESSDLYN